MKAIALIDKPKSCASCPFINDGYAFNMCNLSKRQITTVDIPDWCELRQLPKKEEMLPIEDRDDFSTGYTRGWNECLEEVAHEVCENCPEYSAWDEHEGWCEWGKGVVTGKIDRCGHLYRLISGRKE